MTALGDGRRIERGPWGNGGHWDLSWGWDSVRRHLLIAVRLRHVGVRLLEELTLCSRGRMLVVLDFPETCRWFAVPFV